LTGYGIITHTDMDGVAGAGLYALALSQWPSLIYFTEPYKLHELLEEESKSLREVERLVLIDLGINPSGFTKLVEQLAGLTSRNIVVEWFDHHLWEEEWVRALNRVGVKLYLDTSTCATGVVYKYFAKGRVGYEIENELVPGVCAGDLWTFDHWRGGWYLRLIKRRDSDSWRLKVMREIFKGRAWANAFTRRVEEIVDAELKALSDVGGVVVRDVDGVRIVSAFESDSVENSFLAAFLLSRFNGDIAVVASGDGKISLRSRRIDVRRIALKLGGGGHMYASGARIQIPYSTRLLSLFNKNAVLNYVAGRVVSAMK